MFKKLTHSIHVKTAVVAGFLSALPYQVMASLPTASAVADGASTTSPIQMFRDFGQRGVTIAATVVGAAIAVGIGWAIYSSFVEAREKGDWKKFGLTAAAGVVVAASTVTLAILAVSYATVPAT